MTISASQGRRPIPINAAKAAIRKIISRNPAIQAAVQGLVPNNGDEKAIFTVYQDNYVFSREVDRKLDDL